MQSRYSLDAGEDEECDTDDVGAGKQDAMELESWPSIEEGEVQSLGVLDQKAWDGSDCSAVESIDASGDCDAVIQHGRELFWCSGDEREMKDTEDAGKKGDDNTDIGSVSRGHEMGGKTYRFSSCSLPKGIAGERVLCHNGHRKVRNCFITIYIAIYRVFSLPALQSADCSFKSPSV